MPCSNMPKIKHTARKNSAGSSVHAPPGTGSDDSDGPRRPFKRVARCPPPQLHSSSDGSDFEDDLAAEDRAQQVATRKTMPKPRTRRPSYLPPPPPEQPEGEAHRISLEPPPTLGREVTDFTTVPKSSYFTFRRDVDKFSVCLIRTIYPKMGDRGSYSGYYIDIMSHVHEFPKRKINVPHFLWHEIRLASLQYKRAFPHAPFIQAFIHHVAEFTVAPTHTHHKWVIPAHMADSYAPKKTPYTTSTRRTAARSATPSSSSAPLGRCAKFIGKAHSAMMKAFSFQCGQTHDVVSRLVSSKNALKARLRDSGTLDVSDDEALPAAPPFDFGFPYGPEWADFLEEGRSTGLPDDDDDDDDDDVDDLSAWLMLLVPPFLAKILSGKFDRLVRKFFNATGPESMEAHESGPTDESAMRLFRKMTDNIKKLWCDASNDRETPLNPLSIDHSPLDMIDVPQQHNNVDCGFFMLTNVNSFHHGDLANYTHEDISDIRKTWLYAIATSNLFEIDFMELFDFHASYAGTDEHKSKSPAVKKQSPPQTLVHSKINKQRSVGFLEEVYGKDEYKVSNQPNWVSIAKRPTYVEVPKQGANECGFFWVKFCFTYDGDGPTEDSVDLGCPTVDDWKAEFMYNLVFSPKNEILREELPADIRELA
ncbi:hypothetical protein ZWY2020_052551 [Hordeum vulgare]|nr:hypothetical protein ZWY2020_052551 [Hordeum vulgare]